MFPNMDVSIAQWFYGYFDDLLELTERVFIG